MDSWSTELGEPSLRVALVKDGETFPQHCAPWTLRTGTLAAALASRGHNVTWYASTFMHNEKEFYATEETLEERAEGYRMHLLHAGGYGSNISFSRWRHHAILAWRLYGALREGPKPDVVVCCIPILEVAAACELFCRQHRVPLVLDIRDPWPETFVAYAPARFRPFVRLLFWPYFVGASRLFRGAQSLVAVSGGFLSWAQTLGRRSARRRAFDKVVYHGAHQAAAVVAPEPMIETAGLRSIYMGAFSGIYEFEPLARLMEAQHARGDSHHLFLVGKGGERYETLKERFRGLGNVTFTGWLPREQAYALARTCHLGWLPLAEETEDFLPNKPFEYATLGMAVATSSQGEAARLVEQNGLGFSYAELSSDALLELISSLSPGSEQLEGWRARCGRFSREIGDARVCAERFADHLERLVELSRRPTVSRKLPYDG